MSEQKTEYKWNIERLEEMRVQHEMNPSLLSTKQAYINALEYELNAATAEANKRIEAIESEVAELKAELKSEKEHSNILLKNGGEFYRNELALKAHINTLREALFLLNEHAKCYGFKSMPNVDNIVNKALSTTPAESLQAHDDLRKLCEKIYADLKHGTVSRDTMELLREALKEVK